jgi:hypothetical protein
LAQKSRGLKLFNSGGLKLLSFLCYNNLIVNQPSVDKLIKIFLKKGGRIDKYYLQDNNQSKHTLLYLKGWFAGKNMREAINKAIFSPKNK